jgi:hypothetical protein
MRSLLLALGLLVACAECAAEAETVEGSITALDLKQYEITVDGGNGPVVYHVRPSAEVILEGRRAKLQDVEVGSAVTLESKEPTYANRIVVRKASPVGVWKWYNGATVTINADGTVTTNFNAHAKWRWLQNPERRIQIDWNGSLDDVTLTADMKALAGKNNKGEQISAARTK